MRRFIRCPSATTATPVWPIIGGAQPFEALARIPGGGSHHRVISTRFIDLLSEGPMPMNFARAVHHLDCRWPTSTCWCLPTTGRRCPVRRLRRSGIWRRSQDSLELGGRSSDAGVLATLLLNRISLAPGRRINLPTGSLHAMCVVSCGSDGQLKQRVTQVDLLNVDVPGIVAGAGPLRRRLGCGPRSGAAMLRPPMSSRPRYWCSTASPRPRGRRVQLLLCTEVRPTVHREVRVSHATAARPWLTTTARSG